MRWARAIPGAGVVAASLVTVALAAPAAPGGTRVAHSAASKTECCFVLTVRASGHLSADYGQDYTSQNRIGSESYTWQWGTRDLLQYSEYAGQPSLERPLNRRYQPAPSLRQAGSWRADSNEVVVYDHTKKPPDPDPCSASSSSGAQIQDTLFVDLTRLRNTSIDVRTRFAGHKFVMRLLTDPRVFPDIAPCLDTHTVGDLEAPPLPNGQPDQAHRPMGSRPYYLTLPPRAFLRQSHGAKKTVTNKYAENITFKHGYAGSDSAPNTLHTVTEQTQVTATFHWFPRSRLAKNVQRLRDEAAQG